jgi:hypothetical protein
LAVLNSTEKVVKKREAQPPGSKEQQNPQRHRMAYSMRTYRRITRMEQEVQFLKKQIELLEKELQSTKQFLQQGRDPLMPGRFGPRRQSEGRRGEPLPPLPPPHEPPLDMPLPPE